MSGDKRDLTRIEDLGEFIHQLEEGDEGFVNELPELPQEDSSSDEIAFGSEEESTSFDSPPEETPPEDTHPEETPAEETTEFGSSETDFGGSTDFSTSSEETSFESTESFSSTEESTDSFAGEDAFGGHDSTEEAPQETESSFDESTFDEPEPLSFEPESAAIASPEPEPVKTLLETPTREQETYKAPENFSDIKKFSESSSFTGMGAEGNPSFSVMIKSVRYVEDVNDIMLLMKELGLTNDSEEQMRSRLMRGTLLVPRISEFAAVLLAHKLRRFDIDILVGLSDEIHPPKHGEAPETGIVSKHNLYQNQIHHFHFDDSKLEISQIIVAATPTLEGYQVVRYLGVASEHKMLDGHLVEDETSTDVPRYYQELAQKLKAHALKAHSNAVVGLNYQLTPLPSEYGMSGAKYRLTCTGNLVWVNKL